MKSNQKKQSVKFVSCLPERNAHTNTKKMTSPSIVIQFDRTWNFVNANSNWNNIGLLHEDIT